MDEPLSNYQDLLDRMKKAVPFLQGVDDQQIVISYKDLSLQTFINIDRNESTREYSKNSTTTLGRNCSFLPTRLSREIRPALKELVHNIG